MCSKSSCAMPVFIDISSGVVWRKPLSSMLPMMSSAVLRSSRIERGLVELPHQMLLQRFLGGDGIEKELAFFFFFLRAAAVAARLRHVIAPFVIELRQLIELLLEILFRRFGLGLFGAPLRSARSQVLPGPDWFPSPAARGCAARAAAPEE